MITAGANSYVINVHGHEVSARTTQHKAEGL